MKGGIFVVLAVVCVLGTQVHAADMDALRGAVDAAARFVDGGLAAVTGNDVGALEGKDHTVVAGKDVKDCESPYKVGEICRTSLKNLYPTQSAIGQIMVRCKVESLKKKHPKAEDLDDYLREHVLTVVVGPEHELFLTDGHHEASAILAIDKNTPVYVSVTDDLSHMPNMDYFWKRMSLSKWVWVSDRTGHTQPYDSLPRKLEDLANDPYRSLSGLMRTVGFYKKSSFAPFAEFYWSDYMRMYFGSYWASKDVDPKSEAKWLTETLKEAGELARADEASYLPGWGRGEKQDFDCSLFDNHDLSEI